MTHMMHTFAKRVMGVSPEASTTRAMSMKGPMPMESSSAETSATRL